MIKINTGKPAAQKPKGRGKLTGAFFTPLKWAEFAVERFGLFERWKSGATVFDPTMGEGHLLEALISTGLKSGVRAEELPVENLYGLEVKRNYPEIFLERISKKYSITLRAQNFTVGDIFFLKDEPCFDILFGNPPWCNFVDLPETYKRRIKSHYFRYDLVGNSRDLLLGCSRTDIAALVIQKTIDKNLKFGGEAFFFMPLSLLLNDGANKIFRKYSVNGVNYRVNQVYDFNKAEVFRTISTRYGLIHIIKDREQTFPIEYRRWEEGSWVRYMAEPIFNPDDPLSIMNESDLSPLEGLEPIPLRKRSTPRQGVNTCGANAVFFFDSKLDVPDGLCLVSNQNGEFTLPAECVHPLLVSRNFSERNPSPEKWVLIPYARSGKPLSEEDLEQSAPLKDYLYGNREILEHRRGSLINTWMKKGLWWALLGVGEYSFYPYKIVWEAYGKSTFKPVLFSGEWQANQSLQAFMPFKSKKEAMSVLCRLRDKKIEKYLRSLKMEGTMNWAQPGKIRKLIKFVEDN